MDEEALFFQALDQPAGERDGFLAAACAGNAHLRRRVEVLLRAHDEPASFLARPAVEPLTASYADPAAPTTDHPGAGEAGTRVGPYKLLQRIGEGGMGEVWMAEQTEPVRRQVAVKLVRPGMDSKAVLARFDAERQALALMDHPNIAKVLDAGATGRGRPYFVMELVKGVPITRFCDDRRLGVRDRVAVAAAVCRAVQHAHQKGVIHRDLKPSNVLVALYDGHPVPKVIDFGIAKAAGAALTDKTLFTGFGAVVGTPEYMSPEQAELNQLDVDTRSDVYSLGVLLYELLTGTTPIDRARAKGSSVLEVLRLVREEEPPPPSTRLTAAVDLPALAATRGLDPRRLAGAVRGELDWIVMRCLEKDRDRRYQSAGGLADDLDRYLADESVLACPPSRGYRARKLLRRHRAAVTAGAVVAAALVAGAGLSVWHAYRATRAEATARAARGDAEANLRKAHRAVNESFVLVSQDVLLREPAMEPLRKSLLQNALRYHQEFVREHGADPTFRAELVATYLRIAVLQYELGPQEDWLAYLEKGVDEMDHLLAAGPSLDDLRPLHDGVMWMNAGGRWHVRDQDAAFRTFIRVRDQWERLVREYPDVRGFRNDLAVAYLALGVHHEGRADHAGAARCYEQARDLLRGLMRDDPGTHYRCALILGQTNVSFEYARLGRRADALAARREAAEAADWLVARYPQAAAFRELQAGYSGESSAGLFDQLGMPREAEEAYRRAVAGMNALVREQPAVARYRTTRFRLLNKAAPFLWWGGSRAEAEEMFRQLRSAGEEIPPTALRHLDWYAWFLVTCPDPAFRDPRRALEIAAGALRQAPDNLDYLTTRAVAHYLLGDYRAAAADLERAVPAAETWECELDLYQAMAYHRLGDPARARQWYDRGIAWARAHNYTAPEYRLLLAEAESLLGAGR